ncbi:hypothetical protein NUACC21_68810 [Scytonema sp. NUACC21]
MELVKSLSMAMVSGALMVLATATQAKSSTLTYERSIGSPGIEAGNLFLPQGIDVQQGTGNVFISDSANNRVSVFDQNGNFVNTIGSLGSRPGQFNQTADLAFDKLTGNLYVGDVYNSEIDVFDANRNYLKSFGKFGPQTDRPFFGPGGVAFDASGNFYVNDYTADTIQVFDRDGNVIKTIGSSGNAPGQFLGPSGLSISEQSGNIYVTDFLNNRIQVLNPQGEPILVFGELGNGPGQFNSPVAIEVDDEENIYVGDALNNRVQVFDKNGNYLSEFGTPVPNANPEPLPPGQPLPEPGQFNWTVGAHFNDGKLYVSDFYNSRVQVLKVSKVPEPASILGLAFVGIGAVTLKLKRDLPLCCSEAIALLKTLANLRIYALKDRGGVVQAEGNCDRVNNSNHSYSPRQQKSINAVASRIVPYSSL